MLSLSPLPSLVSRDLFLMMIQVSADSFCCRAFAGCRAAPGPCIALQRTFDNRAFHALLIEEPVSGRNLEAVLPSSLPSWPVAKAGFRHVRGMGKGHCCTCSDTDLSHHHWWYHSSPLEHRLVACWWPATTTRGTEQHLRGSMPITRRWVSAHLKERKIPQRFSGLERMKNTKKTKPKRGKGLAEFKSQEQLCEGLQQEADCNQNGKLSARCSLTGGHMDAWKLKYVSLYEVQCPFTLKAFANLPLLPQQPWNSDWQRWEAGEQSMGRRPGREHAAGWVPSAPWIPQNQCSGCEAGKGRVRAVRMPLAVLVSLHPRSQYWIAGECPVPALAWGYLVACDPSRLLPNRGDDFQEATATAATALAGFCYVI